jgi:hypothetical protein
MHYYAVNSTEGLDVAGLQFCADLTIFAYVSMTSCPELSVLCDIIIANIGYIRGTARCR